MKKEPVTYQQIQQQIDQQYQQRDRQQSQAAAAVAAAAATASQHHQPAHHHSTQDNESSSAVNVNSPSSTPVAGGRFDFDDGGVYVGGWQDGKAHGHGICTGPKGQGEYSGSFSFGFEVSGVYKWPSGAIFEGQWSNGKRHGLGIEYRGKWVYKGEWTQGYKGRYGVRASLLSSARYEGTWASGLQDGYGFETYADNGTYQGQWLRGLRHGYGVRSSAPYGHCNTANKANLTQNPTHLSIQSLDTEISDTVSGHFETSVKRDSTMRGGFVLVSKSSASSSGFSSSSISVTGRRRHNSLGDKSSSSTSSQKTGGFLKGLRLKKQKSTGDIDMRSSRSTSSSLASSIDSASSAPIASKHLHHSPRDPIDPDTISNSSFISQAGDINDPSTTETYMGEWKNDRRCGFGICERSDGLRYEGEWYHNKKYGYGVTFFRDGTREEGKYKNNCLVTNAKKKHLFVIRSSKLRERIESAVAAARQAQQIALQKADIAISRAATARSKAEQSEVVASQSRNDSTLGYKIARQCGGSDIVTSSHQQPPEAPMRGRMSNFSSIRRGQPHKSPDLSYRPSPSPTSTSGVHSSLSGSRQYLDVSEPFAGRSGSFRTKSGSPSSGSTSNPQLSSSNYSTNYNSLSPSPSQTQSSSLQFNTNSRMTYQDNHPHNQGSNPNYQYQQSTNSPQGNSQFYSQQQYQQNYNENAPLNDHLDHYQKLVSRYGKVSKPPAPDSAFNRLSNRPSSKGLSNDLNKFYGTGSTDSGRDSGDSSDQGVALPQPIDMSSESSRTPLRTSSLYRLPTSSFGGTGAGAGTGGGVGGGGGGSGGGGPLKRKPSLQSISTKPITEPVMSREEVSVLSHVTREQRRQEAERAERLTHNPLLYFVDPRFKEWLSRQQIIIAVILINITLAIIFFKLLG